MRYRWRDMRFEVPEARDTSSILLVDPLNPPSWNLSITHEDLAGGPESFQTWVASQAGTSGSIEESRTERMVSGRKAVQVERSLAVEGQEKLRQLQVFIHNQKSVVVVTLSSKSNTWTKSLASLETLLNSLTWESP